MELKSQFITHFVIKLFSSNRTFMELKYRSRKASGLRTVGSNRTFMELKLPQLLKASWR